MQCALTIAGSDSSAGAGIQADLKTFAALGVYGTCAITAITAQNTRGVAAVSPIAAELVTAQIDAVAADFSIHATKVGMLATAAVARAVVDATERHGLAPLVLDPILVSSSGTRLLDDEGFDLLRARLLPLASVVTPNAPEAQALTGVSVRSPADARRAAERLVALGARAVVITGGHFDEAPIDVVLSEGTFTELRGERVTSAHTHGTGCTFSAALAARLALGDGLLAAVQAAKAYVTAAIRRAPDLGHGHGPLGHF